MNNSTSQNINPYMTDNLYGLTQDSVGNRANSVFNKTLTNFGNNQALQIEETLTGSAIATTTTGSSTFSFSIDLTINFTDQSKSTAPQCLGFVTFDAGGGLGDETYPLNYYNLSYFLGSLISDQVITMKITKTGVLLSIQDELGLSYSFVIYVIAQNTLNI